MFFNVTELESLFEDIISAPIAILYGRKGNVKSYAQN